MKLYIIYDKVSHHQEHPIKYFDSMKSANEFLEECKQKHPDYADRLDIKGITSIKHTDGFVYNIIEFDKENNYVKLQLDGCYLDTTMGYRI